jgi:hypothetical protein
LEQVHPVMRTGLDGALWIKFDVVVP